MSMNRDLQQWAGDVRRRARQLQFFVAGLLLLVVFALLLRDCACGTGRTVTLREVEYDTVVKIIPGDTVVLRDVAPTRIIRTHDTLVVWVDSSKRDEEDRVILDTLMVAMPFEAMLDTLLYGDTLMASFRYPPPAFSFDLRQAPDSMQTIYITETLHVGDPWYEKLGWSGIGVAITILGVGIYELARD